LGVDDGTKKARALDMEIIEKCLVNEISTKKSKKHLQNTPYKKYGLQRIYKMGWCGRYLCLWSEFCK
jgi:hypothetical protein